MSDDTKSKIKSKLNDFLGGQGENLGKVGQSVGNATMNSLKHAPKDKHDGGGKEGWKNLAGDLTGTGADMAGGAVKTGLGMGGDAANSAIDNANMNPMLKTLTKTLVNTATSVGGGLIEKQINNLLDGRHIGRVNFIFHTFDDKKKEIIYKEWFIDSLTIRESMNEPYECVVDISSRKPGLDPRDLMGKSVELWAHRSMLADRKINDTSDAMYGFNRDHDITWRSFAGIVHRVRLISHSEGGATAQITVVPAFWALQHNRNTRIFQDMTIPDILDKVLSAGLKPFNRKIDKSNLCREYLKREYTVQFDETDLNFVSRLMEEEGIAFYFEQSTEHPEDRPDDAKLPVEMMHLTDATDGFGKVETRGKKTDDLTSNIPYNTRHRNKYDGEAVHQFAGTSQRGAQKFTLRDYDWTRPDFKIETEVKSQGADDQAHEVYAWKRRVTLADYSADNAAYAKDSSTDHSKVRFAALTQEDLILTGEGRVAHFRPGGIFKLQQHPTSDFNVEHILTSVVHNYDSKVDRDGETPGDFAEAYENSFECVPKANGYLPPHRHKKPKVSGIQTAKVVGPGGEEIHTDEHGRIKVQFHWDRLGKNDEKSSCWIRVAQTSAGPGWGFMFLPRVGTEVIVQFLDGDPDHPIITGTVYNGKHRVPTTADNSKRDEAKMENDGKTLPHNKTRSFIRTRSTPEPQGDATAYNELSFEDAAGKEQVYIQAQRDMKEFVKNDHSIHVLNNDFETVGKDQTVHIKANRKENVDKDETIEIGGNRGKTVKKDETITIEGKRTEEVKKSESITIKDDRTRTVKSGNDGLKVESGKRSVEVKGDIAEKSSSGSIGLDSQGQSHLKLDAGNATLDAAQKTVMKVGGVKIEIDTTTIKLTAGPSTIELGPSGIKIKGPMVGAEASAKAEFKGATVSVEGSAKTDVKGAMVTVEGTGMAEVKGGMVKVN